MRSTAFAMVAPRAGEAAVVLGVPTAADAALTAEIAAETGLNGRTVVVDVGTEARERAETAAGRAGALIEFEWAPVTMLPLDTAAFDIAVVNRQLARHEGRNRIAVCEEALRMINARGRVVVIERLKRPGLFAMLDRAPGLDPADVKEALIAAGAKAVRLLAEVDGTGYWEAK